MTQLVHRSIYTHKLRAFDVHPVLIAELAAQYDYVSTELVTALCNDDRECGIDPLLFGKSEDCNLHDGRMLCRKHGFPIRTPEETAAEFAEDSTEVAARGLRDVLLWPFKLVIGVPVGWALDKLREKSPRV